MTNEKEIKVAIEHLKVRNMSAKHIDMAIKALEKQIPKKMEYMPVHFPCDYKCPNGCHMYEEYQVNYCYKCGQKIDWND